jgi:hypothetical protein
MDDDDAQLTEREVAAGWHWCAEWDGLLVGPGMRELECCRCGAEQEAARNTKEHREAIGKLSEERKLDEVF